VGAVLAEPEHRPTFGRREPAGQWRVGHGGSDLGAAAITAEAGLGVHAHEPTPDMKALAEALHEHGVKSDLMESRAAFALKRKPNFKGGNDPENRYRLQMLDKVK
jgi:hypothetical protein